MERSMTRSPSRLLHLAWLLAGLVLAPAVYGQATITLDKSFAPSTIGPGSVTTLRFDVTNFTSTGARGLTFSDTLPAGVTIAAPANTSSTCGGTVTAPDGGGTISFAAGSLPASSFCSITVDVTSSTPGTHTNTTSVLTWDSGSSSAASAELTVATDRPGFQKSFLPSSVAFGGRSTLTFTLDNTANGSTAFNLSFTDSFPVGLEVASPLNASTTCGGATVSATAGGSSVSLSGFFSSVAAGASCTVTVEVIGNAVGNLDNVSGELTSSSGGPTARSSGKASATLTVTIEQVGLSKRFVGDPAFPGDTVDLEFTVQNFNRRSSATDVTFDDDLDATLSGLAVSGSLPASPCGSGSSLSVSGVSTLTLNGGNLGPEGACTFTVTLAVPSGAAAGTYLNETTPVSATIDGSTVTGYPAADVLGVAAGLSFTKTFLNDPVGAGGSVDLEFTITNSSGSAATDIAFSDELVAELPTASSVPAGGFCGGSSTATFTPPTSFTNPTLLVAGASLDPGESCTFTLTLDVAADAATNTYDNTTGEMTATIGGETVSGGTASDSLVILGAPRLFKEFTDDPAPSGGTVTLNFTLTYSESSPANATNVTFTDNLELTLTGLVYSGSPVSGCGGTISGTSNLTFSGGTMTPGETCSFSVTLDVPADAIPGTYVNATSTVMAEVNGVATTSLAATNLLSIAGLVLTQEFVDDPALPGDTLTLRYTLENTSPNSDATAISLSTDLDDALTDLAAIGVPTPGTVCGSGTVSALSGGGIVQLSGGELVAGATCSFDVTLLVPLTAADGNYPCTTGGVSATFEGQTVGFDGASDVLVVASDFVLLTKEFTDDPASPGGTVTLQLSVTNLHDSLTVTNLAFTDDLDAALPGLEAIGLPSSQCGGTVSGTDTVTFSGGSLAAGASCTITVTLLVPSTTSLGTVAESTTSEVTGTINGFGVSGIPASDILRIDFVDFSKSFSDEAPAGGTVTLSFTIRNLSATEVLTDLAFTDDLDATLSGLVATDTPKSGVCGAGSSLTGTSFLAFSDGSLLPGGSCTLSVTLSVPGAAEAGDYLNVTSELRHDGGIPVAQPTTAVLTVTDQPVDSDGDGVLDDVDVCLGTTIPEGVPTEELGKNRWALVDGDFVFDTNPPNGNGPQGYFTTTDTAGCSCEQIIVALGLGEGHVKFGCSIGVLRTWVDLVN